MMSGKVKHMPVMARNVIERLSFMKKNLEKKYLMLDCTLGTAGHAKLLLNAYPNLTIHGIDLDQRMIDYVEKEANIDKDRLVTQQSNFTNIDKLGLKGPFRHVKGYDVILADLGYNSLQLQNSDWGFSYMNDGPLDMRYTPIYRPCSQILKGISEYQLTQILSMYGQLTNSPIIAKSILKYRQKHPLNTTKDLQQAINQGQNIRDKFKTTVKVFQALRIAVNGELQDVRVLVEKMPERMNEGGVGMVITFHSLEEATVKHQLAIHKRKKVIRKIESEKPSEEEIEGNSRSRSATLFTFRKIEVKEAKEVKE